MMRFGDKAPAKDDPMADDEGEGEPMPSLSGMASKKAASKVLSAIESGDAGALDSALKAHYSACEGADE